ncbi:MAG: hypothetical protein WCF23_24445 [Candidatus Nitrosopolaris sp.]
MNHKIDNFMNIHDEFHDGFEGSTYTLRDGQISPNQKWKAVYTGIRDTSSRLP